MTLAQLEERLLNLEQVVAQLQPLSTLQPRAGGENPEELLPGVEYPLVTSVPPERFRDVTGVVVEYSQPQASLRLSDAEWRDFDLEDEDG